MIDLKLCAKANACLLALLLTTASPLYAQDVVIGDPNFDGPTDGEPNTDGEGQDLGGDEIDEEPPVVNDESGNENEGPTGDVMDDSNYASFAGVAPRSLSQEAARDLALRIGEINEFCGPVERAYRIDCLADQYRQIADALPNTGDNKRIKAALNKAAADLEAIVEANLDTAAPAIKPTPKPKAPRAKASRNIRAIRKDRIVAAERAAAKVVKEAETVLLRSAESSRRRKIPFQRVAAATGSNLVLLRSA